MAYLWVNLPDVTRDDGSPVPMGELILRWALGDKRSAHITARSTSAIRISFTSWTTNEPRRPSGSSSVWLARSERVSVVA